MLRHVPCIRSPCDLDLLLFFHRHPCALLAADQIFAKLGYGREPAATSLDALVGAGILTRSRGRSGAICLYVLDLWGLQDDALTSLLRIAATPAGRQSMIRMLKPGAEGPKPSGLPRRATPDLGAAA